LLADFYFFVGWSFRLLWLSFVCEQSSCT
jgi:hypothetical protein